MAARIRAKRRSNISIPLSPKSQAETGSIDNGCMTERYSLLCRFYYPAGAIIPLLVDYEFYTHVSRSPIRSYVTRKYEWSIPYFPAQGTNWILINTLFKSRLRIALKCEYISYIRFILLYTQVDYHLQKSTKQSTYITDSIIRSTLFNPFPSYLYVFNRVRWNRNQPQFNTWYANSASNN